LTNTAQRGVRCAGVVGDSLVSFECRCGQHLSASTTEAGHVGACPACGNQISVPSQPPPLPTPPQARARSAAGRQFIAWSKAGAVVALVIAAALYLPRFLPPPLPPLSVTQQALLANGTAGPATLPVDEDLFLIQKLESLYDQLFSIPRGPDAETRLRSVRSDALRIQQHIAAHQLETAIGALYDSFLKVWSAHVEFRVAAGQIDEAAARRLHAERLENSVNTGFESGVLWAELEHSGLSTGESIAAAALVGVGKWFLSDYIQSQERDAARRAQLQRLSREHEDFVDSILKSTGAAITTLAQQRGWPRAEAGFDATESEQHQLRAYAEAGNHAALRQAALDQANARRRDPFAMMRYVRSFPVSDSSTPSDLLILSDWAFNAAQLTPAAPVYDPDRSQCLLLATWNAARAADAYAKGGFVGSGNQLTRLASHYLRLLRSADRRDISGEVRFLEAHVSAHLGDLRQARRALEEVRSYLHTSAEFHYLDARIAAAEGRSAEAVSAVRTALASGFPRIRQLRSCPDFHNLSRSAKAEIKELTAVRYHWEIKWGFFNDDIILTNLSAFPLTNVTFKPVILKGTNRFAPKLDVVPYLAPGASHTWVDCMRVPGNSFDTKADELISDQNL
jgi:hypothetical protein